MITLQAFISTVASQLKHHSHCKLPGDLFCEVYNLGSTLNAHILHYCCWLA